MVTSHMTIEGYGRFWKDDVIQCIKHMLTLRYTYGHLGCYELKPLEYDQRTTLVLSNTRELNRVPKTK